MIEPFTNNHQSMQIGDLVIENQTDKVIIYGDIDLQLNTIGYEQAQQLHALSGKILQAFADHPDYNKTEQLSKDNNDGTDETIDNPFL